jgi:chromosome segregation ATPase
VTDVVEMLRQKAAELPAGKSPLVQQARQRAVQAAETIEAAVSIDPTLPERDRQQRDIDLVTELLRQLKPLARQAEVELARHRLVASGADPDEIARLGRTNPAALGELDALSQRVTEIAKGIKEAAQPDWNTPQRIRERSVRLLPSAGHLEEIADRLRDAVEASLALAHPAAEAVRLAELADQITAAAKRIDATEE